jgi:hypothetical protein
MLTTGMPAMLLFMPAQVKELCYALFGYDQLLGLVLFSNFD